MLLAGAATCAGAEEHAASGPALDEVVVVGVLPGSGVPLDEIPANVQRFSGRRLGSDGAEGLAGALDRLAGSIGINDTQGNPFQPDVAFRGFTASPVLGTPQGMSVFVDGVRVNEAFGDAVNWDLIPAAAIASATLIPGSNPVFGLNTLGGALTVSTKRGLDFPGTALEGYFGSFGRRALEAETGGHGERLDYFVTGNVLDDDGWAEHNPSSFRQLFAKAGYRVGGDDATLSLSYADNRLEGAQALPLSFLTNPSQSYTWPDEQTDRMTFFDFNASHSLSSDATVSGTAYYREVITGVLNSNVNSDYDPTQSLGPGNQPTGNAIETIRQYRPGGALQLSVRRRLGDHANTFMLGASYDRGVTDFSQSTQEAGASRDTHSNEPAVLGTLLHAVNEYEGAYLSDTLGLGDRVYLNVAGRYNAATVALEDRLGATLNGHHVFQRFNPAIGLTANAAGGLTLYASYGEGMRVPTPIELTCADPSAPCSLPNAFASDPALRAVVARTAELGARGTVGPQLAWNAAIFRTTLDDDIQFVSSGSGAVSAGFFENVGRTRRQGLELGLEGRLGVVALTARYTYLEATYRTPLVLNSPNNSTAAALSCPTCTDIQVALGDYIPGMPRHGAKLRLEYVTGRYAAAVGIVAQSSQFARGDENNLDVNGPVPGFAVVHLDARYQVASRWRLFARVDNLLNSRYSTFGALGRNVFTAPGNTFDPSGTSWRAEQFRTVGVPRGAWVGFEYRAGGAQEVF